MNIRQLFFFCLFSSLILSQEKKIIAVASISSTGISETQKTILYNRLETELVNLQKYNVTTRSEVDKILKEQKFQQSGCTEQACAAEIGRMLNADEMLLANIIYDRESKYASTTLKLVDVQDAVIVAAIIKDKDNVKSITGIFSDIGKYITELYRLDNAKALGINNPDNGFLSITIDPLSLINIEDIILESPIDKYEILYGNYNYEISKYGYKTKRDKITVLRQKNNIFKFNLEKHNQKLSKRRAFFFPGLGHMNIEERGKGLFWIGGAILNLFIIQNLGDKYNQKVNLYDTAYEDYFNESNPFEIEFKKQVYFNAYDQKNEALAQLGGSVISLIVLWAWNIFDLNSNLKEHNKIYTEVNQDKIILQYDF